ncbi:MAG: hypothetical protein RR774_07920, partial [Acinetobacter sp.]
IPYSFDGEEGTGLDGFFKRKELIYKYLNGEFGKKILVCNGLMKSYSGIGINFPLLRGPRHEQSKTQF